MHEALNPLEYPSTDDATSRTTADDTQAVKAAGLPLPHTSTLTTCESEADTSLDLYISLVREDENDRGSDVKSDQKND